jgi:pimeloyl-ACP methyl ester carboxylesterase
MIKRAFVTVGVIFAILLTVVTAAGLLYRPEDRIPEGFGGRFADVGALRLRVVQSGTGPDVLLIHGCPGSVEDWSPLMEIVSGDRRVTAYDRPGHGYSSGSSLPYTLQHNSETALQLIRSLGLKDVVVVGHSYGADTALALALERPPEVRSYVLVGVAPYGVREVDPLYRLLTVPYVGTGFSRILAPFVAPKKIRDGLLKSFGPNAGAIPPGFVDLRIGLWSRPIVTQTRAHEVSNLSRDTALLAPHYREITAPVFIVEGAEEKYASDARRLHAEIRGSELVEIPETGHYVPVVRAEQLAGVIRRAGVAVEERP